MQTGYAYQLRGSENSSELYSTPEAAFGEGCGEVDPGDMIVVHKLRKVTIGSIFSNIHGHNMSEIFRSAAGIAADEGAEFDAPDYEEIVDKLPDGWKLQLRDAVAEAVNAFCTLNNIPQPRYYDVLEDGVLVGRRPFECANCGKEMKTEYDTPDDRPPAMTCEHCGHHHTTEELLNQF